MNKVCKKCGLEKPSSDFYKEKRVKDGLSARCKSCCREDAKEVFRRDPEPYRRRAREAHTYASRRERTLREKYNMTVADYDELFEKQKGCCAICGTTDSGHNVTNHLLVDHDHSTGKVRGLLCSSCNLGIGKFKDDTNLLATAINYLTNDKI